MSLHLCPIEPDDWANGPPDEPEGDECPQCHGSGEVTDESGVEISCQKCDGTGIVVPPDIEPEMSDFI
jgi:DnaJ-class molecular chaperone